MHIRLSRSLAVCFTFLLASVACESADEGSSESLSPAQPLPEAECFNDFVNTARATDRPNTWFVRAQLVRGEVHYLLDRGDRHLDGVDYIVDAYCDTVCTLGAQRIAPRCESDYKSRAWVVLWEG